MQDGSLTGKYIVERADGQRRPNSRYFVLNYANDPYARHAMRSYAEACAETHPALAADLAAVCDFHDAEAARTKRSARPAAGNQGSGGEAASSADLVAVLLRVIEQEPELAAELRKRLRKA